MNSSSEINRSPSHLSVITGGLITGVLQVVLSSSYAALVYSDRLGPYVGQGIGFALMGALAIATVIAIFAARPGTVGSNQDVSVAIFSIISVSIVASMPDSSNAESAFCTVIIAIALTVLLTAIFFGLLGIFRLGGLIRYFPYPVIGGFLAGTGWLLFKGGLFLTLEIRTIEDLLTLEVIVRWLPGFIFAVILLFAVKRTDNSYILPGFILSGILLFFCLSYYLGYTPDLLSEGGWLLGPLPNEVLWQPFTLAQFKLVDWQVIAGQVPNIISVICVSAVALLLNASAFELESREDIDLDRELRLAGVANLFSSLSPGFIGFRQLCLTMLNQRMQSQSRFVGLIGASIIALTLFYGASVISFFPKVIMGGLLMYLGLTFLLEWACETWFSLPTVDCLIIWLVLLVIATFGFMPGVGVGLLAAVAMFVISYSRTEVVRHEFTGKKLQSLTARPQGHRLTLEKEGEQIYILQLQGFIFFGTANRLFNKIRNRLNTLDLTTPRFIIIDFQRVDILDSTGMLSFRKLKDTTNDTGTHLIITAPSVKIQNQLTRGGLCPSHPLTHYFADLNIGIEWCEEQIIVSSAKNTIFEQYIQEQHDSLIPENTMRSLLKHMQKMELSEGTAITRKGEKADDFFFIESGRVTNNSNGSIDSCLHLESMAQICIISNVGFYVHHRRTMDIIALEKSVVYRLPAKKLRLLEEENPAISSKLHQIMVRILAERIHHLIKSASVLEK